MTTHEGTKFFTARQNNSGGYFIENEDVGHYVIIEARNAEEAERKLAEITEDYSDYCECCGERWSTWWSESDGEYTPMIYGTPVSEYINTFWGGNAIVYYIDGSKLIYDLSGKDIVGEE